MRSILNKQQPRRMNHRVRQKNSTTERSIQLWLIDKLSVTLGLSGDAIDIAKEFDSYGLGSTEIVSVVGELELWLERDISPSLAYDFPTIQTLARALARDYSVEQKS
jgi:acyl carrier protein